MMIDTLRFLISVVLTTLLRAAAEGEELKRQNIGAQAAPREEWQPAAKRRH
jgi:hypothetical protein